MFFGLDDEYTYPRGSWGRNSYRTGLNVWSLSTATKIKVVV